jgi:flagellar biosynthetic protein FliR
VPGIEPILHHALPFGLVLARVAGLLAACPMLSAAGVPMKARALAAAALAAALYPALPPHTQAAEPTFLTLLPMIVGESLLGAALGMIAGLPMAAMDMAGTFSGQVMGLGLARVYNPEFDTDFDVLGQLLYITAAAAFTALGGLDSLFLTLARTFENVPPGGIALADAPLDLLTRVLASGCELALRVSLPVVGAVALLAVVLGAIGKTMPQINIMNIGFTLKVFAGLAMIAGATGGIALAASDEVDGVLRALAAWARDLNP